jgi:hypothetical protein
LGRKGCAADREQAKAIVLADDVALLARWLRNEVFAVNGLPYADRCRLFDFLVDELQARAPQYPHRLNPVCTLLRNHRDQLLAFAWQLDEDLAQLAAEFEVSLAVVREVLDVQQLAPRPAQRWPRDRGAE